MNIWDVIITAIIIIAVAAAVIVTVKNKRNGKPSCGGDCAGCQIKCKKSIKGTTGLDDVGVLI